MHDSVDVHVLLTYEMGNVEGKCIIGYVSGEDTDEPAHLQRLIFILPPGLESSRVTKLEYEDIIAGLTSPIVHFLTSWP